MLAFLKKRWSVQALFRFYETTCPLSFDREKAQSRNQFLYVLPSSFFWKPVTKPEAPEQTPEQAPRTWQGSYLPPRTLNARLFEKEVVSPSSFSFLRNNLSSEFRPGKGTVKKSVSLRASPPAFSGNQLRKPEPKRRTGLHANKNKERLRP